MKKTLFMVPAILLLQAFLYASVAQSPTVIINQADTQADPASGNVVRFKVTFSVPVNGFTGADISFAGSTVSGNLVATVTGGQEIFEVSVSGMTSNGVIIASIPAGAATSSGGAASLASTSTDNSINYILPTITCSPNLSLSTTTGHCYRTVTGIDPVVTPANANVTVQITNASGGVYNGVGSASGMNFQKGINTVKYSLTDYPTVSCSFTITVNDTEPPVISAPQNQNLTCAEDIIPVYLINVTATDNCSQGSVNVVFLGETKTNEVCFNRFVLTRTWKATDDAGNTSTASQIITVYDNEPPRFNNPPPDSLVIVACASDVPPAIPDLYVGEDDCLPDYESNEVETYFSEVKSDSTCPNKFKLTRKWVATDWCGNTAVYTQVIQVKDTIAAESLTDIQPSITVSCASEIQDPPVLNVTDGCTGGTAAVAFTADTTDYQCANKFKLNRKWTITDACGNSKVITQLVTVNDNVSPVFAGSAPAPLTVSCPKDVPAVPTQTVTDNCGSTPTLHFSEVKSDSTCAGRYRLTRTWTATDACGNTANRTQVITVYDNESPTLSNLSIDTVALWPPNHKMRDITVNYSANDNCGAKGTISVSSNEPVHGGSDGDQSPDWEIVDDHHIRLRAEKANHGEARRYTIKVTVDDGCNTAAVDSIVVVVAHNITKPSSGQPFKVGTTVPFEGVFWDKKGNIHTAKWLVDGSAVANGTVTEPSGLQNGKVKGSYKFKSAGVYKLRMNVTDQSGITSYANTNEDLDAIVVIYDPNGANAFGGGWFQSEAGALSSDPAAAGKVSYGFAVNYTNAAKPKGETQFEFKMGAFEFNALNFDYLAVSGARAQFRGTGRIIGGQSGIGFIMTVIDGDLDGTGVDKMRMKIYNRTTGYIYYDNHRGLSDADDPATVVGTNSTIVIQNPVASKANPMVYESEVQTEDKNKLQLLVYPNPTTRDFAARIITNDMHTKITLEVYDQHGRFIEKKEQLLPGTDNRLGDRYLPGVYYVRITQGSTQSVVKLTKL